MEKNGKRHVVRVIPLKELDDQYDILKDLINQETGRVSFILVEVTPQIGDIFLVFVYLSPRISWISISSLGFSFSEVNEPILEKLEAVQLRERKHKKLINLNRLAFDEALRKLKQYKLEKVIKHKTRNDGGTRVFVLEAYVVPG